MRRLVFMLIIAALLLTQVGSAGGKGVALAPPYTFEWKGYTWRANSWDEGGKCFDSSNAFVLSDVLWMRVRWDPSLGRWCGASVALLSNLGHGQYMIRTHREAPYHQSYTGLLEGYFLYRDESNSIVNEHFDPHLVGGVSNARFVAAYQNGVPRPGASHDYWDETSSSQKLHMIYWSGNEVVLGEWFRSGANWILNQAWGYGGVGIADPPLYFNISLEVHNQGWVPYDVHTAIFGFCQTPGWGWCTP